MASTNIKLKRSSVQGKAPTTSDLELGEIAINTYDGNLFIKKNSGTESIVKFTPEDGLSGFVQHSSVISRDISISSGNNAISAGPVTIADGISVTIPDGSVWKVV